MSRVDPYIYNYIYIYIYMHVRPADMHVKAQLRSFFCILNSFAVCTKDGCFAYYLGVSRKSLMYVRMYVRICIAALRLHNSSDE